MSCTKMIQRLTFTVQIILIKTVIKNRKVKFMDFRLSLSRRFLDFSPINFTSGSGQWHALVYHIVDKLYVNGDEMICMVTGQTAIGALTKSNVKRNHKVKEEKKPVDSMIIIQSYDMTFGK